MIEFYKFAPQFGLRDASPYCLKLATYLRLAGVPHETHEIMDPSEGPKQKLPFIRDEGEPIGDSELIISTSRQSSAIRWAKASARRKKQSAMHSALCLRTGSAGRL